MKIIHPPVSMKPQLMHLWNTCFEHDEEFCGFFFDRHFEPRKSLALTDDSGTLYAALHFFDSHYQDAEGRLLGAWYIYGVATYPDCRKKGYASLLLSELKRIARKENISFLYLTSEVTAWHMYESNGFCRSAELSRTVLLPSLNAGPEWNSCPLEQFESLRRAYLASKGDAFLWEGNELAFMYEDINREGEILRTSFRGQEYYAAVRLRDGELTVTESSFPPEQGDLLAGSIAVRFGWSDCVALFGRKGEFYTGTSVLKRDHLYIGHILSVKGQTPSSTVYMNLLAD